MAYISYVAKRKLITGHISGASYELTLPFSQFNSSININKKTHTSLSGQQETVLTRIDNRISIALSEFPRTMLPQIREFIHSVAGGETFTVDAYGSAAIPDDPLMVQLASTRVKEQRVGTSEFFRLSFQVMEV